MSTITMDSCSYTRLGLAGYLLSRGTKKGEINDVEAVNSLVIVRSPQRPSAVFINEDCFIYDASDSQRTKLIINQHPNTLFIISMAVANIHFDEYLLVRKNSLVNFKSIKSESLDDILGDILRKGATVTSFLNIPTLLLNRTESSMLRVRMAGQGTIQTSDRVNIKTKTVSPYKGDTKRKIKTHNKQVIYHIIRLTDNMTNGIFINMH